MNEIKKMKRNVTVLLFAITFCFAASQIMYL